MDLLSKQQIDIAQAQERKLTIDEGKKIAERVDQLRELYSKEQSSLMAYRDGVTETIQQEIGLLLEQKAAVVEEIATLTDQMNALMKPINDRATEFDTREQANQVKEDELRRLERKLNETQGVLDSQVQDIERKEQLNVDRSAQAEIDMAEARKQKAEALAAAEQCGIDTEKAAIRLQQIKDDILYREAECAARERELAMHREWIAGEQDKLNMRERAIIDREERFAREVKRTLQ